MSPGRFSRSSIFPGALLFAVVLAGSIGCRSGTPPEAPGDSSWAADAIWYQIFVERFRNGDPDNDPRPVDTLGAWPHLRASGWRVTP